MRRARRINVIKKDAARPIKIRKKDGTDRETDGRTDGHQTDAFTNFIAWLLDLVHVAIW